MNLKTVAPVVALSLLPGIAQADIIGAKIGIEGWQQDSSGGITEQDATIPDSSLADDAKAGAYLVVEHPVPLLPNIKLRYSNFDTDGEVTTNFSIGGIDFTQGAYLDVEASALDLTLYYELLDLDILSLDAGVTIRYLEADFYAESASLSADDDFTAPIPMLYASALVGLPFTGLYAKAEGNYLGYDGSSISDMQLAVGYEFVDNLAIDMAIEIGYRSTLLEIDDIDDIYADLDYSGVFVALQAHF